MGCTSSAPNMNSSSTAEKSIQFEEEVLGAHTDDVEEILYRSSNNSNETNVLPSCDNLAEPLHLDRNRSSNSLKTEKDNLESKISSACHNKSDQINEEKIPKLEKLVDKVLVESLHNSDHINIHEIKLKEPETNENEEDKSDEIQDETKSPSESENSKHIEETSDEAEHQEEEKMKVSTEEAQSPSQSESSRATRWEALADIAAELPPSLMVDPITGQIYSVSK